MSPVRYHAVFDTVVSPVGITFRTGFEELGLACALVALRSSALASEHTARHLALYPRSADIENKQLRAALDGLLEIAEQVVDTRRCSVGVLRAMNTAREALRTLGEET